MNLKKERIERMSLVASFPAAFTKTTYNFKNKGGIMLRKRRTVPPKDRNTKVTKNINLLDRPLFIPSRVKVQRDIYSDGRGYEIKCTHGLPVSYDIDLLNLLLQKAQSTNKAEVAFRSMSELLQTLGYSPGKRNYELVTESLERWSHTYLSFRNNTFYVGSGRYTTVERVGILTINRIDRGGVKILINDQFIGLNSRKFATSFPIKLMSTLTPFSKRLFEILKKNDKNFLHGAIWSISIDKLKLKIPVLSPIVNSKLLWMIEKSCDEINRENRRYGSRSDYYVLRSSTNNDIIRFTKE